MTRDGTEMAADERDRFLGRGGTGVLALANDDVPYAIPVSYAYDAETSWFYVRLANVDRSEKSAFVGDGGTGRLVVYARVDGEWKSVVAVGPLEPVSEDDLTPEVARTVASGDVPLVSMVAESDEEPEYRLYRLRSERLTARAATADPLP